MHRPWTVSLAAVSIISLAGTLAGLPQAHPLKLPLIALSAAVLTFTIAISLYSPLLALSRIAGASVQLGIVQIYARGHGDQHQARIMAKARGSLRILVVSGRALIFGRKEAIVDALANGANLQILLATPHSQFVRDIESAESPQRQGEISREIASVEKLLTEYVGEAKKKAVGAAGSVSVGYYSTELRCSLILCDTEWGWLTINLPPRRAVETCSFELRAVNEGLLAAANSHFDRVWQMTCQANRVRTIGAQVAA